VTLTTLVTGATAAARENAIAAAAASAMIDEPDLITAFILEGLPDGSSRLDAFANSTSHIIRIAPGCLCCTGNLTMRVTLNRVLRKPPARLYIGLATSMHLERMRAFLNASPYGNLLQLTKDIQA
jgi:hypothetical protein